MREFKDNDYTTDGEKTAAGIVVLIAGFICLPVLIPLAVISFSCRLMGWVLCGALRLPLCVSDKIFRCLK